MRENSSYYFVATRNNKIYNSQLFEKREDCEKEAKEFSTKFNTQVKLMHSNGVSSTNYGAMG